MYQLHIANKNYSSWSLRPWLLLSELGIPFEERLVTFAQGNGASWQAFRAFSPNGKVPCLHDGERVVWDSLAIAEYLADRHVDVWPSGPDARAWARCAAAEMHSGFAALRNQCGMNCGLRIRLPVRCQQRCRPTSRVSTSYGAKGWRDSAARSSRAQGLGPSMRSSHRWLFVSRLMD
jgi:hypothetical protein